MSAACTIPVDVTGAALGGLFIGVFIVGAVFLIVRFFASRPPRFVDDAPYGDFPHINRKAEQ